MSSLVMQPVGWGVSSENGRLDACLETQMLIRASNTSRIINTHSHLHLTSKFLAILFITTPYNGLVSLRSVYDDYQLL